MRLVPALVVSALISQIVAASVFAADGENKVYSDKSLVIVCGVEEMKDQCEHYVRGLIEAWMLLDASDSGFRDRGDLTFCQRVWNFSPSEWVRLVKLHLKDMPPGFGAVGVMKILHEQICK